MNIAASESVAPYHKGIKEIPSQEYLRACFEYRDGWLFWKRRPVEHFVTQDACTKWGNKMTGKKAGHKSSDGKYIKITLGKTDFYAQRIIWTWCYGTIPPGMEMDHIDGNGLNNKIENLRLATIGQNAINKSFKRKKKSNLPKGITMDGKLYRARVVLNRKVCFRGWFKTQEEAEKAYQTEAAKIHGEFARKPAPSQLETGLVI